MTDEKIIKDILKEEEDKIKDEKLAEIKRQARNQIQLLLTRKEQLKSKRNRIDEELKAITAELEDIKKGNIDSIKSRHKHKELDKSINIDINVILNAMNKLHNDFWKDTYKLPTFPRWFSDNITRGTTTNGTTFTSQAGTGDYKFFTLN